VRNSSVIGRTAAIAAVAVALVAVVVILLSSGSSYKVRAIFSNASQIVSGDLVQVAGSPIGTVSDISLTPNGQAQVTLSIDNKTYEPLRQGTQADIRQTSLSGIANRYVDIRLGSATGSSIPAGGVIGTENTTDEVDLDQLFNTLDGPTRKGLQNVIQGSASEYVGRGPQIQKALKFLNPAIASSSMLFSELNRNTGNFTNFILKTGGLVTTVAQRSSDLSGLIAHLSTTTQALASQRVALGQSLQKLPGFMRLANTTFVNLRRALDDLTPLVNASKPVAPKLQKLLEQLKPLAEQSVPTVRDLANIISRPGSNNDLTELTRLGVPLANATVHQIQVNGKLRPGAFNVSTTALNDSTPELAVARPYAVDLTGWFEGYTHPGTIDANGGSSRVAPVVGVGSIENGALNILGPAGGALLNPVDFALRSVLAFGGTNPTAGTSTGVLTSGQGDRCPGSMERGAVFFPESGFPCNPSETPVGP
jgi:phospholipid/cholesterol/gamma-HCH transport system substrate-binding protein